MSNANSQAFVPASLIESSQWEQINQLATSLNKEQLLWVSGFLAGAAQQDQSRAPLSSVPSNQPQPVLTVLYGSQTGNAKAVAEEFQSQAQAKGLKTKLASMSDYKAKQIKQETHVVIVVSTHGEGDAPDDAIEFHEFLGSKKAPKLAGLKYSVLGLGDSSYEFFCQTAKDFDERLSKLGATAMLDRVDCDVDYDSAVEAWSKKVNEVVEQELKQSNDTDVVTINNQAAPQAQAVKYNKKHPYTASLSESLKITGRDSVKDIRHIEISLEDSGISYEPGDALGVWFINDGALVEELLSILALDGEQTVTVGDDNLSLRSALVEKFELTQSYPTFVKAYAEATQSKALLERCQDLKALRGYLAEQQIVDIVRAYPGKLSAQALIDALRPISPRLYSIASSQAEVEDEVHLTVALVEYEKDGLLHQGGASSFLSKRLDEGGEVKVFVEHNKNFRLPENPDTPVIMIGPGTGIAPFRAFMQQREADDAQGKNWLFFGNPSFTQDFLYQVEWQKLVKNGVVDKVSLAFSRDQKEKIYVQHRILEQGEEVYKWLQEGAHLYICGDATRMAKDVHEALISVVSQYGNMSAKEAESYLTDMRRAKRYQKDVY